MAFHLSKGLSPTNDNGWLRKSAPAFSLNILHAGAVSKSSHSVVPLDEVDEEETIPKPDYLLD